jgi:hypothetical protein
MRDRGAVVDLIRDGDFASAELDCTGGINIKTVFRTGGWQMLKPSPALPALPILTRADSATPPHDLSVNVETGAIIGRGNFVGGDSARKSC